ncbi:oligosaccharide flippase family protein [Radiobacillus sp. PE A8.2]|uniref:oligosaccharide flippase family protein n=1 Tax=Radiobacillus sp. PE A8.2 TaxID=3380349 RepID=UPI00388D17F2
MSNKSLIKGTAIYTISELLIKAGSVLMLPLFTFLLTPEEYGIVGLLTPISGFLPLFFSYGLYLSQGKELVVLNDKDKNGSYIFTINVVLWVNIILVFLLFLTPFSQNILLGMLESPNLEFYPHIFLAVVTGFIGVFTLLADNYYQTYQNFTKKAVGAIISFLINMISSLVLIYFFDLGATGKLIGNLLGNVFLMFFFYVHYIRKSVFHFHFKYFKEGLAIGIPAMFNLIVGYINNYSDRIIINKFLTLSEVGIYSIAYTGSFVLNTIINSFMNAWRPLYFRIEENSNLAEKNREINQVFITSTFIIASICLVGQLFQKELITLVLPDSYHGMISVLPILLFGILLNYYYLFFANFHVYNNTYKSVPFYMFFGMVINIVINLMFVKMYGIVVAAYSTVISNVFMSLAMILTVHFKHRDKYKINFKLQPVLLLICFNPLLLYLSISAEISFITFLAKVVYLGMLVFIAIKFLGVNYFKSMFKKLRRKKGRK